jgi:hypothetical protein
MELKKITTEMRGALRRPLPDEAVKPHPTKTFLSSIKAIYVTERLNEVFGVGSWQLKVNHITTTDKSMVVVKIEFTIPEYGIYYECYGGNDNGGENSKNFDLGDAYKGATTDAITKVGSYLEVGIDVFKGKYTPPVNSQPNNGQSNNDKPCLNKANKDGSLTENWQKVIEALKGGGYTLAQVEGKYKISKENKAELLTIKSN